MMNFMSLDLNDLMNKRSHDLCYYKSVSKSFLSCICNMQFIRHCSQIDIQCPQSFKELCVKMLLYCDNYFTVDMWRRKTKLKNKRKTNKQKTPRLLIISGFSFSKEIRQIVVLVSDGCQQRVLTNIKIYILSRIRKRC